MRFIEGLKGLFGKAKVKNLLNQAFYQYLNNGGIVWFDNNRKNYVEKGYSDNEIVFAIVRVLLSKLTEAPFILSKVVDEKSLKKFKNYQRKGGNGTERAQTLLFGTKALEEIEEHDLLDLLKRPNNYQGQAEFLESAFGYYKLLGETFIYKIAPEAGPNKGKPVELHVLPAHLVEVVYSGDYTNPIRGYKFSLGDQHVEIPAEYVMHLKTWNPNWDLNGGQMRGFSPLQAGSRVLTRNNYNKTAQTKAFVNGGSAYLLSSADGNTPMTIEQVNQLNDRIREKLQGPDNYHTITATTGLVTATKIGESAADMMLIEADKSDLDRICMIFGVDPSLFSGDSKYENKEKALKALVTNVVLADLLRFRDSFSKFILPAYGDEKLFLDFDTTVFAELQPDLKLLAEVYGKPRLTENERRALFNFDASEEDGMDSIWMESGLIKMSDAGMDLGDELKNLGDYK